MSTGDATPREYASLRRELDSLQRTLDNFQRQLDELDTLIRGDGDSKLGVSARLRSLESQVTSSLQVLQKELGNIKDKLHKLESQLTSKDHRVQGRKDVFYWAKWAIGLAAALIGLSPLIGLMQVNQSLDQMMQLLNRIPNLPE